MKPLFLSFQPPVLFLAVALTAETVCIGLATAGSKLALNVLIMLGGLAQLVTLILLWYVFRMLVVVHKHVTTGEGH